jgi:hypothetical protein
MGSCARRFVVLALAAIAAAALGALVVSGTDESEAQAPAATIRALSFASDGPAERRTILDLGGLRITAACTRYGAPGNSFDGLSVTASSAVPGAAIVSSFLQREGEKGASVHPYVFALQDFGPAYGPYDFLGTPFKVAGDLHFSRPDGGEVSVSYATPQLRTTAGCRLDGTAVYAPADTASAAAGATKDVGEPVARSSPNPTVTGAKCPPSIRITPNPRCDLVRRRARLSDCPSSVGHDLRVSGVTCREARGL